MKTWLLLRGLGRDSRHWVEFPEQLRARIPGAEFIALDLPGNGVRNDETSPDHVPEMVETLRQDLRRRKVETPIGVIALSLGGMIALEWARQHPEDISHLVLLNTSLGGGSPFYQRLRPAQYLRLIRVLASRDPETAERTILRMTSARHEPALCRLFADYHRARPVSTANLLRQLRAAARYRGPISRPDSLAAIPALLLASRGDRLVDIACSRRLARSWHWPLVEHPNAGHDLPLDDGPWVAEQIAGWLGSLPESSEIAGEIG